MTDEDKYENGDFDDSLLDSMEDTDEDILLLEDDLQE